MHPTERGPVGSGLLVHVLMADIDFATAIAHAFKTSAETLTLTAVEHLVDDGAQGRPNPTLGNLGPVLGPVGFNEAGARIFRTNGESLFVPKFEQLRIDL